MVGLASSALLEDPALAAQWDELNEARRGLPFLSSAAMGAAIQAFGTGQEQLFFGQSEGKPVAMIIAIKRKALQWQCFQPPQLPLGAWVAHPEVDVQELTQQLVTRGPRPCWVFSLTQIDPLLATRPDSNPRNKVSDYIDTAWVDIAGSFDTYWEARGKNLRQNLRKQRNKLAAGSTPGQMRCISEPSEMAAALARYGSLENAGWKAATGTAVHPDNAQGRFYTQLLTEAAKKGQGLVYEYLFGERTVAMNLCVANAHTLTILKTAYDESTHPLSPAFLLMQDVLEQIYAQGRFQRMEFYGRVMEWHTRWTDQQRGLYHVTAFKWPALLDLERRFRKPGASGETVTAAAKLDTQATVSGA